MKPLATVIGIGAIPVGRHTDSLEHEMIIPAFLEAVRDAGVQKSDIESFILSSPRPYIEQKYFATFLASYLDLPIESTRPAQCRVECIFAVGSPDDDDLTPAAQPIHQGQQLGDHATFCLARYILSFWRYGVDLVDEDNGR